MIEITVTLHEPVFSHTIRELVESIEKVFEDKNDEIIIDVRGQLIVKQK